MTQKFKYMYTYVHLHDCISNLMNWSHKDFIFSDCKRVVIRPISFGKKP